MVFRKLLAGLGFGGVEADTVLSPQPSAPGAALSGQVNLRVKSDTEIAAITLILVANGALGEIELGRYQVAGRLNLAGGGHKSVPFSVPVPAEAPFTVLYGQALPGINTGVRTELTVASGSAKGDFDPVRIDATPALQHIMDALGTIGARFARNELRHGGQVGLAAPAVQAVTFYAPVPDGQAPGPHIPQVTFVFAGSPQGLTVIAELAARSGSGDKYELSTADIERLSADEGGWVAEVDRWLVAALDKLGQAAPAAPGAFLQQAPAQQLPAGYGQPGRGAPAYAYGGQGAGQQGYKYGGYQRRPGMGMGGAVMAGVAGGALGFLGGMMIADALTPDMAPEAAAAEDPGMADAGGYEDMGGGDFGGGDFGGGDFGGDFGGF